MGSNSSGANASLVAINSSSQTTDSNNNSSVNAQITAPVSGYNAGAALNLGSNASIGSFSMVDPGAIAAGSAATLAALGLAGQASQASIGGAMGLASTALDVARTSTQSPFTTFAKPLIWIVGIVVAGIVLALFFWKRGRK